MMQLLCSFCHLDFVKPLIGNYIGYNAGMQNLDTESLSTVYQKFTKSSLERKFPGRFHKLHSLFYTCLNP